MSARLHFSYICTNPIYECCLNHYFLYRPTSLDAFFLGHVHFTVHALPESSVLRSKLLDHANLMNYAENLKMWYLDASSSSSSIPQGDPSSSSKQKPSYWSSKPKTKPKKGKTVEEKKLRRRAKYFLATQLVAILVFLSIFGGHDDSEIELENDNDGLHSD
ncbi:mitochondrial outer membrane import complex protein METAXIN-like [Primulina eburnea]|uniref:mitochondrial outer membrane import complex protein METAXIN-like n=1 Tax=Primulina eburnea TaxID=1245227 RepID=UPI003C6CBFC8